MARSLTEVASHTAMTTLSPAASDMRSLQQEEYPMVEVPPPPVTASWQKSSASGGPTDECVQVKRTQSNVRVRDSKNPRGAVLELTAAAWAVFLSGVQRDEFVRVGSPVR